MDTPDTTRSTPPSPWCVRLHVLVVVISIAVCGGALLGITSAYRAYFDRIVFLIAGSLGAIVGLATAPVFFLAARRKDWRMAIPAIYIPSLMSALITSDEYSPLLGAAWTIATFLVACVLCRFLIPNTTPAVDDSCPKCGYQRSSKSLQCSECGVSLAPTEFPIRPDRNRLIVRFLPFLLIPIASIGFRAVFGPADLSSLSTTQLTQSLASNDMQRRHEASQELASRGMETIQQLVDHDNANVRRSVARAVRSFSHEDAATVISKCLADADRYVRLEAIWAIQYDFGPSLLPALEDQIQRETDSSVKDNLEEAIAYMTKGHPGRSQSVRRPNYR